MNELVFIQNNQPVTTSKKIAWKFGKEHSKVLRAIRNLECSDKFFESNFGFSLKIRKLQSGGQKEDPEYIITRDGFTFLAMGFTGKRAAEFKEEYISDFNRLVEIVSQSIIPGEDVQRLLPHLDEQTQKDNTKKAAKRNYGRGGVSKIIEYQNNLCYAFNHLYPYEIKERIKNVSWLKASEKKNAKAATRRFHPDRAAGMSLSDYLVHSGIEAEEAIDVGKSSIKTFRYLDKVEKNSENKKIK